MEVSVLFFNMLCVKFTSKALYFLYLMKIYQLKHKNKQQVRWNPSNLIFFNNWKGKYQPKTMRMKKRIIHIKFTAQKKQVHSLMVSLLKDEENYIYKIGKLKEKDKNYCVFQIMILENGCHILLTAWECF